MAKSTKNKGTTKQTTKPPKEVSNIFHSIMKASVKDNIKPTKGK